MPKTKNPEDYTSRDLLNYWNSQFHEIQSRSYESLRWGGLDLSDFKTLLTEHDVFSILLAIRQAVKSNTIISEFRRNFRDYDVTSAHPKLEWLISFKGKIRERKLWAEYEHISSRWFPSSSDAKRLRVIEEELKEWAK